jgi:hypothetical protein
MCELNLMVANARAQYDVCLPVDIKSVPGLQFCNSILS